VSEWGRNGLCYSMWVELNLMWTGNSISFSLFVFGNMFIHRFKTGLAAFKVCTTSSRTGRSEQ
jgi:hypothetical protein